jgi:FkbM family methyltransferase
MNEKEKFLDLFSNTEPKLRLYSKYINYPIIRAFLVAFLVKEKFPLKLFAIFIKKIFNINLKKRLKLFWGKGMVVYLADSNATALFFLGTLAREEIKIIKFLIKILKEDDVFYDIGANYGFYTMLAKEFIRGGEIHSFEPNPVIFRLLEENCKPNILKNVYLNKTALSDKNGYSEFYDREIGGQSGMSSLIKDQHSKKIRVIKVKTIKIDDYILTHKPPSIIKMDVEGAEPFILKGATKLLRELNPIIIMEFFPDALHRDAVSVLLNNKYNIFGIDNEGDLFPVNETDIFKDDISHEANYVFIKQQIRNDGKQ